jgi:hypothetical protein
MPRSRVLLAIIDLEVALKTDDARLEADGGSYGNYNCCITQPATIITITYLQNATSHPVSGPGSASL